MNQHKNISNLSLQISTHSNQLTKLEKDMIQELVKKRHLFTFDSFTIANIAQTLNVSSTSLHRLSKKLGYHSFTLFKEDYFKKAQEKTVIEAQSDYLSMLTTTFQLVQDGIQEDMLEAMVNAEKITIYGMGMHSLLGKMYQIKLELLGISVQQYDDSRYMRLSSKNLRAKKDVIIILSRSGMPPELIEAMVEANKSEVTSILISEAHGSALDGMATHHIYVAPMEDQDENINTRINTHIAMDLLLDQFVIKLRERKIG